MVGKVKESKLHPIISIIYTGKSNGIMIGRDVIRALGMPSHICILKSIDKKSIAIASTEETEYLSWRVPKDFTSHSTRKFRVYSQSFVDELLKANHLERTKTHTVEGEYIERDNLVIFPLKVL